MKINDHYKFLFIVIFISLFILFSCDDKHSSDIKTIYFPDTDKICQVIEYKNEKKSGSFKEFYPNGKLKIRRYYVNDTLQDSSLFFHENGKLQSVELFEKGKKKGCWKNYTKEGVLISVVNFKNNELDGESITYTYRSGRILKKLNYKEGDKEGKQEYYYNNGKPKCVTYYHHNVECEGTEEWYENGEKVNNDFDIFVKEQNKLLLEDEIVYTVRLENPQKDDRVALVNENDTSKVLRHLRNLEKEGDHFILSYNVVKGSFLIEKIKLAAYRKTVMGNTYIKTTLFNVFENNY